MIRVMTLALAASLAAAGLAEAKNNHANGGPGYVPGNCPPGLAKKNPPCIPPGQAKKARIGDYYYDYDYVRVHRSDPRYDFFRIGDIVVSADRRTGRILHLFDELGRVLE